MTKNAQYRDDAQLASAELFSARSRASFGALAAIAFAAGCGGASAEPEEPAAADERETEEREPAAESAVLIVAIDGLRPADVSEADTPNLDRLAEDGAFTNDARAVMPTITRTNFVTFATGGYADEHGVIGGLYWDDGEERETDGPTMAEAQEAVPLPTIFEVAEAEGYRTGMFAMKGYELVGARGASAQVGGEDAFPDELWDDRYEPEIDGSAERAVEKRLAKNEVMVGELEASLEEEPLDLILINLGATDYIAHQQSPESEHYIRAIEASDALLPELEAMVERARPDRNWHVIVGTDHGFSETNRDQLVIPHLEGVFEVRELEDAGIEHRIYERGGRAAEIYLAEEDELSRAAELLSDLPWIERIYADEDIPERAGDYDDLRVSYEPRRGEIYAIVNTDYAMAYPNIGMHGSNDPQDLVVPIWIAGPRVPSGEMDLSGAENTDIGPTALSLLGIDPDALEGSGEALVP